ANIGTGRYVHAQAVTRVLLDKSPLGAQQGTALRFTGSVQVHPATVLAGIRHQATIRWGPARQHAQQCGFARSGLSYDAQHLAGIQLERYVLAALVGPIQQRQILYREKWTHDVASRVAERCPQ